jgi:hypothetical protein
VGGGPRQPKPPVDGVALEESAVTLEQALEKIDPALGAEVPQLDRAERPDRFQRALKYYRAGLPLDWIKQSKQWIE